MTKYFFTGGIMPSKDIFNFFDEDLTVVNSWEINGKHYSQTSKAWLKNMDKDSKIIKEIRGKGLWLGVEIDPNYVSGKELSKMCLEAGILCKETHETTIRYAPPLVITKEELDWGIEKINAVFSKITI